MNKYLHLSQTSGFLDQISAERWIIYEVHRCAWGHRSQVTSDGGSSLKEGNEREVMEGEGLFVVEICCDIARY